MILPTSKHNEHIILKRDTETHRKEKGAQMLINKSVYLQPTDSGGKRGSKNSHQSKDSLFIQQWWEIRSEDAK